jgi:hypothetical protein
MLTKQVLLALLSICSSASSLETRNSVADSEVAKIIAAAKIPKYALPSLNRDNTDWLAVGDSYSAGISADIPDDEMNSYCSRFKKSYSNQMNVNPKFPGDPASWMVCWSPQRPR